MRSGCLCHANRQAWGPRPRQPWKTEVFAVSTQDAGRARVQQETCTARLAKFFPEASPVRIPVRLTRVAGDGKDCTESTVIEFGTAREVLFSSTLPLEFADRLKVQNSDGTLDAEVSVVPCNIPADAPQWLPALPRKFPTGS